MKAGTGLHDVCISHDGRFLASLSTQGRLWDARTGTAIRALDGAQTVNNRGAIAFSPDDRLLAGTAAGPDDERLAANPVDGARPGVLRLWDVSTGQAVRTLPGSGGGPVAFTPDGKRVAGAGRDPGGQDDGVRVWQVATGKVALRLPSSYTSAVGFSPDGKRLAAGSMAGEVRIWNESGREVFAAPRAHASRVVRVCFTRDGKYLVTAGQRLHRRRPLALWERDADGEVKVWDVATGRELFAFLTQVSGVSGMALSPDSTRVAASTLAGQQPVRVWSLIR
jgi:WD40 repeat protein